MARYDVLFCGYSINGLSHGLGQDCSDAFSCLRVSPLLGLIHKQRSITLVVFAHGPSWSEPLVAIFTHCLIDDGITWDEEGYVPSLDFAACESLCFHLSCSPMMGPLLL